MGLPSCSVMCKAVNTGRSVASALTLYLDVDGVRHDLFTVYVRLTGVRPTV